MEWLKTRLVDDWRNALKWSSVRLHLAMLGVATLYAVMPALDPQIAGILPEHLQGPLIGLYAIAGIALRLTKLKPNGEG
jgi:hypothetical protein